MGPTIRGELQKRADDPDTEHRPGSSRSSTSSIPGANPDDDQPGAAPETLNQRDTLETSQFTAVGKITTPAASRCPVSTARSRSSWPTFAAPSGTWSSKPTSQDPGSGREPRRPARAEVVGHSRRTRRPGDADRRRDDRHVPLGQSGSQHAGWRPNFGWYVPNSIANGALVAAVGDDEVFKVGSKASYRARAAGCSSSPSRCSPSIRTTSSPAATRSRSGSRPVESGRPPRRSPRPRASRVLPRGPRRIDLTQLLAR